MSAIEIDHLRSWIGREQRSFSALDPFPARALAAALDHARLPEIDEPLPPSWHWLYFLDTPSSRSTGSDGHPHKGGFLPPVPLPRRMWAAGKLQIAQPLRLGIPAEKISTIASVELKVGKTGVLVFVNLQHRLLQDGALCISEEQNLVYREMPTGFAPLPSGESAPVVADWSRRLSVDPVLLFRFSALTYNAHRIHYDREYATREEFYPGLVVHGPLLATLLLDGVLREQPDAVITQFGFRAVRPTIDLGPVTLAVQREGNNLKLWSADFENFVGMSATATIGDRA